MRILVLTLSFGAGHLRAAHAVARALGDESPSSDIRVLDALSGARRLFRAGYVLPYWMMIRHCPRLWGRYFQARVSRRANRTAPDWAFRRGCPQVFQTIESFRPDVIVAAEVAACELAVIARRQRLTRARIVSVITDYETEPVWVKPEVDAYAVPDDGVGQELSGWGVPREKIVAAGIPIDPAFRRRYDARATRRSLGIKDDAPIVLLMGGGMGPTGMHRVAARLVGNLPGPPAHLVAVTGHDRRVRRRTEGLRACRDVTLRVLGWTNKVPELMQAAALLVTKPGGLTLAEAAASRLPVVMFDAIPGPEQRNAERFARAGAGLITRGAEETARAAARLIADSVERHALKVNIAGFDRPGASSAIAQLVL